MQLEVCNKEKFFPYNLSSSKGMLIFHKQINIQAFKKITIPRTFTACLKTCSENFIATDIGFKNSFLKML